MSPSVNFRANVEFLIRNTSLEKGTNTNYTELQTVGGSAEFIALNQGTVQPGSVLDREYIVVSQSSVTPGGPQVILNAQAQPVVPLGITVERARI